MASSYYKQNLLRIPFAVLALLLIAYQAHAYHPFVDPAYMLLDSLESELDMTTDPSQRTSILLELTEEWLPRNQEKALNYVSEAIELATEHNDSVQLLDAEIQKADLLVNYQQSFPDGIDVLNHSLGLTRTLKLPEKELRVLHMLGYVHSTMESFNLSHQYYQLALNVAVENGFEKKQTDILMRIAEVLEMENKDEEAKVYYETVIDRESQNDFANTSPETMVFIGHHYQITNDHAKAIEFFRRSLPKFEQVENARWAAYVWSQIALEEFALGNHQTALESGESGLAIAERNELIKELADNHANLATINDSLGNYKEALFHFKAHTRIMNDIYSVEKAGQFASIQAKHELELKELSLRQTEVENELQSKRLQTIYVAACIVLFLVVVLIYFAYRRYRLKKNINLQLEGRGELKNLSMSEVIKQLRFEVEDHQETREQLERSNEELNHFLYKSSHDLRGPLVSILGLISLAEMESATESERDHYLDLIRISTTRISQKLDALLHATRLKDKSLEITLVNLYDLIQETVGELVGKEDGSKVEVLVDANTDLVVETDQVLMQTLIANLVENGIRFRNPERDPAQVWVSARMVGSKLMIKVRDNGMGIPESEQQKVFEMFVRADFKRGGSGLGLYLVEKIIEKLQGEITLRSKVGDGTTIEVMIG